VIASTQQQKTLPFIKMKATFNAGVHVSYLVILWLGGTLVTSSIIKIGFLLKAKLNLNEKMGL
jgi:hypothetical protein